MTTLYKHQKDILKDSPSKTLLALGTGGGKTRIALLLAKGKTFVIMPKTQFLDKNWEREVVKLGLSINLTTISKEKFKSVAHTLPTFDTVIVDELHMMCGVTPALRWRKRVAIPKASQLFEALDTYLQRTTPTRFYGLTATPTRSPMCVWGIAKLLGKTHNFYEWRQAFYFQLPMPGREVWMAKNDNETKDRLAKVVRSLGYVGRLEDFFDVPEQTFRDVYVILKPKQKERLKKLPLEYPDPLVLLGKELQVENGLLNGDEFNKSEVFDNEKIEKIVDFSFEFPRMVIFCRYLLQIEEIRKRLEKCGRKVFVMTGEVKNRGGVLEVANKTEEYVFLVSAQISAGWELPNCAVMVFASRTYSIVDYIQSLGRIHRANSLKKNLFINLITKGGIDEAVHKALENKKDFSERIYLNL